MRAAPEPWQLAAAPVWYSTVKWTCRAATGSWRLQWRQLSPTTTSTAPAAVTPIRATKELSATVAWLDDEPLVAGRVYWALHGHRWVKAKVKRVVHKLEINTLAEEAASQLDPNAIGHVELLLQEAVPALSFADSRVLGALILVDTASHKTSGAVLVN